MSEYISLLTAGKEILPKRNSEVEMRNMLACTLFNVTCKDEINSGQFSVREI